MIFELSPLWGLLPLLLYIILSFRGMDMIWVVLLCVILGGVLTGTPPIAFGNAIAAGLGSFMGLIGFIILIGAGLGEVLVRAGVAPTVVYKVMNSIGIKSQSQAMIATLVTSTVIVALLGTMAGGNAILAPILIPIMATLRIKPATLGVITSWRWRSRAVCWSFCTTSCCNSPVSKGRLSELHTMGGCAWCPHHLGCDVYPLSSSPKTRRR